MRYLLEDADPIEPPSDHQLRAWFDEHPERFDAPPELSFTHLFFSRGKRGAALAEDARSSMKVLQRDPNASVEADPFFRGTDFDPGEDAYYYARVLEQPTCRWNNIKCLEHGVDCSALDPADGTFPAGSRNAGYEGCCDITDAPGSYSGANRFDVIRERAWTSPIWHETLLAS